MNVPLTRIESLSSNPSCTSGSSQIYYEYDDKRENELRAIVDFAMLKQPPITNIFLIIGFDYIYNPLDSMMALSNHAKVGFAEGLSTNLSKLKVTPIDGFSNKYKVSFIEELETENVDKLTESYLGLLLNCGVIGALVITLLFQVVITSQDFSDASIEYFTEDGCVSMFHIFYILVTVGFYMSIMIVANSIFKYKQLSFWMSKTELKSVYIEKLSIVGLIVLATILLPGQ